jgi:hypothetical protein
MATFDIAARVKGQHDGTQFHVRVRADDECAAKRLAIQRANRLCAEGQPVTAALLKQHGRWVGICPACAA